jgi:transposase
MLIVAKFIMDILGKRIGKRQAKQIIYVILLAFGVERKVIKEVFGASEVTLCKYNAAIKAGTPEIIFEQNYNRPQSELEKHKEEIYADFDKNPPSTRREAAARIEKMTGIKRSITRIGKFVKKGASKAEP